MNRGFSKPSDIVGSVPVSLGYLGMERQRGPLWKGQLSLIGLVESFVYPLLC